MGASDSVPESQPRSQSRLDRRSPRLKRDGKSTPAVGQGQLADLPVADWRTGKLTDVVFIPNTYDMLEEVNNSGKPYLQASLLQRTEAEMIDSVHVSELQYYEKLNVLMGEFLRPMSKSVEACGITQEELDEIFPPELSNIHEAVGKKLAEYRRYRTKIALSHRPSVETNLDVTRILWGGRLINQHQNYTLKYENCLEKASILCRKRPKLRKYLATVRQDSNNDLMEHLFQPLVRLDVYSQQLKRLGKNKAVELEIELLQRSKKSIRLQRKGIKFYGYRSRLLDLENEVFDVQPSKSTIPHDPGNLSDQVMHLQTLWRKISGFVKSHNMELYNLQIENEEHESKTKAVSAKCDQLARDLYKSKRECQKAVKDARRMAAQLKDCTKKLQSTEEKLALSNETLGEVENIGEMKATIKALRDDLNEKNLEVEELKCKLTHSSESLQKVTKALIKKDETLCELTDLKSTVVNVMTMLQIASASATLPSEGKNEEVDRVQNFQDVSEAWELNESSKVLEKVEEYLSIVKENLALDTESLVENLPETLKKLQTVSSETSKIVIEGTQDTKLETQTEAAFI